MNSESIFFTGICNREELNVICISGPEYSQLIVCLLSPKSVFSPDISISPSFISKKILFDLSSTNIDVNDIGDGGQAEKELEVISLRCYIERLVERLPAVRREIFRLSRFGFLPNKEIANRLSISEKTVETQLYRALRFLRERLSDDGLLGLIILLFLNGS